MIIHSTAIVVEQGIIDNYVFAGTCLPFPVDPSVLVMTCLPIVLQSYITTFDWRNVVFAILMFPVCYIIWYPFYKMYEKQCIEQEKAEKLKKKQNWQKRVRLLYNNTNEDPIISKKGDFSLTKGI